MEQKKPLVRYLVEPLPRIMMAYKHHTTATNDTTTQATATDTSVDNNTTPSTTGPTTPAGQKTLSQVKRQFYNRERTTAKRVITIVYTYDQGGNIRYGATVFKRNEKEFFVKKQHRETALKRFNENPIVFPHTNRDMCASAAIRKAMFQFGCCMKTDVPPVPANTPVNTPDDTTVVSTECDTTTVTTTDTTMDAVAAALATMKTDE